MSISEVRCKLCGETIALNLDGPETRAAGIDPAQQLRRHILECHVMETFKIGRAMGWLIDVACFDCPADPEKWKTHQHAVLDATLEVFTK